MKEEIFLETPGYRLRVQQGMFHMTIPDLNNMGGEEKEVEYAPHQVATLLLGKDGGSVSITALTMAIEHDVDVYLVNGLGDVLGMLVPAATKMSLLAQKAQFQLIGTPASMVFVKEWIGKKFQHTIQFFQRTAGRRKTEAKNLLLDAIARFEGFLRQLNNIPTDDVKQAMIQIRGCEGNAGRLYWSVISQILPAAYSFEKRTHPGAYDLYNAATNYAYGIMYRKIRRALVCAGLHPFAGFLHSMERNGEAMVYDFIEPYRPWSDELIYLLCNGKRLTGNHLIFEKDGHCRLHRNACLLIVKAFQQVFSKKPEPFTGKSYSLDSLITSDAKAFAWLAQERNEVVHPTTRFTPGEFPSYY